MAETFLILLSGGVMLAAAVPQPRGVELRWLRLAGIIALAMLGLSAYFYVTRTPPAIEVPALYRRIQVGLIIATAAAVLAQLAFVQVAWRATQRVFARRAAQ